MTPLKQSSPFIIFFLILTALVSNNGFFWDSIVLGSGYGHWYYTTNFQHIFVSDDLAGYPPLFGLYLALGWKLFGKTLVVSHVLMLPFLIGIVLQVQLLVKNYVRPQFTFWVLLLVLIEPTLLAQATQVAPDIVLVFLYLLALNNIIAGRRISLAFILIAVAMLSPRGTIMVIALYFSDCFLGLQRNKKQPTLIYIILTTLAYLPAFIITCLWLFMHYQHFGWIFYNKDSAWGQGSELVSIGGFFRNLLVIGWRFADFGKAVALLMLLICTLIVYRSKRLQKSTVELAVLVAIPFIVLSSVLIFFSNPIAHRYYLIVYILLLVLLGHLLQFIPLLKKTLIYSLTVISLLVGHFIVALYTDQISKGWDATLAHLPYYNLRSKMINYIKERNIPVAEVGSAYPNLRSFQLTDLENSTDGFKEKDLSKQQYIFYSNVFNDFSDEELLELKEEWEIVKEFKRELVVVRLYYKAKN